MARMYEGYGGYAPGAYASPWTKADQLRSAYLSLPNASGYSLPQTAPRYKWTPGGLPNITDLAPKLPTSEQPLRPGPTRERAALMNAYGLTPSQAMGITYASQAPSMVSSAPKSQVGYTPSPIAVNAGNPVTTPIKSSITGGTPTPVSGGNIPVSAAGDIPIQSTDDIISMIKGMATQSATPDFAVALSQGLSTFLDYANAREAALRAQAEKEGKNLDLATLADIQRLKDAVQEEQQKIKEFMNSRGILDSGITLAAMDKSNKGLADNITKLQLARSQAIQDRLRSALDQLWSQQFPFAENYASGLMNAYSQKQKTQMDVIDRLMQAARDARNNARSDAELTGYYNGKPTLQREQYDYQRRLNEAKARTTSSSSPSIAEEVAGLHNLVSSGVIKSLAEGDSMIEQALRAGQTDEATADYLKRYLRSLGLPAGGGYQPNPDTFLSR